MDIIHVPMSAILTAQGDSGQDEACLGAGEPQQSLADWQAIELVWQLAQERKHGASSFFAPYLASLPTELPSYLLNVSEAAACVTDTVHLARLSEIYTTRLRYASRVAACLQEVSIDDIRFSVLLALTRCFSEFDGVTVTAAMVPFVDLLNAAPYPNVAASMREESPFGEGLTITTRMAIAAGEELTLEYLSQQPTNFKYLTHWGFVLEDNPFDELDLVILAATRRGVLQRQWYPSAHQAWRHPPGLKFLRLGNVERLVESSGTLPEALAAVRARLQEESGEMDPVMLERASLNHVLSTCRTAATRLAARAGDELYCVHYRKGTSSMAAACAYFAQVALYRLGGEAGPDSDADEAEAFVALSHTMLGAWALDARDRLPTSAWARSASR